MKILAKNGGCNNCGLYGILYKNCNNSQDKTYKEICLQDLQANEGNFFRSGVRCINSIIISFLLLILNKSPRKGQ